MACDYCDPPSVVAAQTGWDVVTLAQVDDGTLAEARPEMVPLRFSPVVAWRIDFSPTQDGRAAVRACGQFVDRWARGQRGVDRRRLCRADRARGAALARRTVSRDGPHHVR